MKWIIGGVLAACIAQSGYADITYAIDDGAAELAVGIDPDEDLVWLNTFGVLPGGDVVDSITVAWGRPGGRSPLNGLTALLLLYDDATGGSPEDAALLWSREVTIADANTPTLHEFDVPLVSVSGTLVVGVLFSNPTAGQRFVAPLDRSEPAFADRSYIGFDTSIDPGDLGGITPGNFGTTESFGLAGNYVVRAHAVPGSGSGLVLLAGCGASLGRRRRDPIRA